MVNMVHIPTKPRFPCGYLPTRLCMLYHPRPRCTFLEEVHWVTPTATWPIPGSSPIRVLGCPRPRPRISRDRYIYVYTVNIYIYTKDKINKYIYIIFLMGDM